MQYLKMVKYLMIFHLSLSKGLFLCFILFELNYDMSGGNSQSIWKQQGSLEQYVSASGTE